MQLQLKSESSFAIIVNVPVKTPATARSKRTRSELARAAHAELAKHGTLNADATAASAGVSTATFYSHFATHDDAAAAALDISLTAVVGVAEEVFHIESLIEDGLDAVIRNLIREMHNVFRSESLVMRAALARLPHHKPTRQIYRGHEQRSLEHLTRQIDLGQKAGLLSPGQHDLRATTLLVVLQGLQNPLLTKKTVNAEIAADLQRAIKALLQPCEAPNN